MSALFPFSQFLIYMVYLSHCSARCRVGLGSATERSSVWLARIGCWTRICVRMRQGQKTSSHALWQNALASSGTSASGRRWVLATVQVSCMQYQFGRYLWNVVICRWIWNNSNAKNARFPIFYVFHTNVKCYGKLCQSKSYTFDNGSRIW